MSQLSSGKNRLKDEKSPYLLQHKDNPVDWFPWGEEAFQKARKEDKMIFLSIGYSTCHWCHVMERESFENEEIAKLMNELFVNIKVDREERPDIDKIYMTFLQVTSGRGGWPLSVFLTPDLKPIVAGTYFPSKPMYGVTAFPDLLKYIATMWKNEREKLLDQSSKIIDRLKQAFEASSGQKQQLTEDPLHLCFTLLEKSFDPEEGGFTAAPKFPRPVIFNFLLRYAFKYPEKKESAIKMVHHTLTKMGAGGIWDHLGLGFHRYSVTGDWHVPHFEKMLYDNAQLVCSYLEIYQVTKDATCLKKAKDILSYVSSKMTSPEGGFYSAEDADSLLEEGKKEHAEGAFYVWEKEHIDRILGNDAKVFNFVFGVSQNGNVPPSADAHGEFKGKNILIQKNSFKEAAEHFGMTSNDVEQTILSSQKKLFEEREKRPKPHLDDKIITAWNGLMISAFSKAYQITNEQSFLNTAKKSATFIENNLYNKTTQTLIRNFCQGPSQIQGFADDYAFLIQGLLDLYEASFETKWLQWANILQQTQNNFFWDKKAGGYFVAREGDKNLVMRLKEDQDGAEPCNNSVSAFNLQRLSKIFNNQEWGDMSEAVINSFWDSFSEQPIMLPLMCSALQMRLSIPIEIVIAGHKESKDTKELLAKLHDDFIPNKILLLADQEGQDFFAEKLPWIKDMNTINEKAAAYVCENFSCQKPVTKCDEFSELLKKLKISP